MKQTITAIIPAQNEEKNIGRCIKSILWCNKILVISSGNDKTAEIAKKLGAIVIVKNQSEKNNFEELQKNINRAINDSTTDWMIRIDADEIVTEELKKEIIEILNKPLSTIVAYGIPRKQFFLGKFLKGGDWAYDRLIRLFRPKYCQYEPIVKVHEQFKVNGKIGYLKSSLLHYSHPDMKTLLKKFNVYTDLEVKEIKDNKLLSFFKLVFMPPYIFLRWMIYHHGYRDGIAGILAGVMRSYYDLILYYKRIFRS